MDEAKLGIRASVHANERLADDGGEVDENAGQQSKEKLCTSHRDDVVVRDWIKVV